MKLLSLLFLTFAGGTTGLQQLCAEKVAADINGDQLNNILKDLGSIAQQNEGNRAFGLPGFDASVEYVLKYVNTSNYFDILIQPFSHLFSTTRSISLIGPDGKDVPIISLQYNHPTPSGDPIETPLVHIPVDGDRGSGCYEDQWEGIDIKGKIALSKRGGCHFIQVLKLAKSRGAAAVIIYNNVPGQTGGSASLGAENQGSLAPVGVITYEQGTSWVERIEAGETLQVKLAIDVLTEERETRQIIIETKEGDPENVIFLGAHLDSVQEGPGINDNGSGIATLLSIAKSFQKFKGLKNKVRFAWWAAEESGMIGSNYYVSQLPQAEIEQISFYFNYDMTASPNAAYFVYADSESHKVGGQHLYDYLTKHGYPAEFVPFGTSSDYVALLRSGIPSSGIFSGAGAPYDACYHTSCDDNLNADIESLTVNAKAAGYAAARLALMSEGLPIREQTNINPLSRRGAFHALSQLSYAARGAEKKHSCGEGLI